MKRRGEFVEFVGMGMSVSAPGFSFELDQGAFGHVLEHDPLDPTHVIVMFHPMAVSLPEEELRIVPKSEYKST